jgi:hypothetical protein
MHLEDYCRKLAAEFFIIEDKYSVEDSLEELDNLSNGDIPGDYGINIMEPFRELSVVDIQFSIKELAENYKKMYDAGKTNKREF